MNIDLGKIEWSDCPRTMTDEVAFALGKFDFPCFYDQARWCPNREYFKYVYFFNWYGVGESCPGGQPNGETKTFWYLSGALRVEEFKLIEHKKQYIKGRLASYSVSVGETFIDVTYANSFKTRDILADFIDDVLRQKFSFFKQWSITKTDSWGTAPAIAQLELKAEKEVIDYLTT